MLNKSFPVLPVPEILDANLNHSFKVSNARLNKTFIVYIQLSIISFFSLTSAMTSKESRNHQNSTPKSSASPAMDTTKYTQFPFVIR